MYDQPTRQPFRFHIPWVMNQLPSRPLPPLPPPTQTQPAQTTTTERPPFRPAGVAPPRHSPQPPSPSRTAPQSPAPKISSEPQAQPKVESKPPSPTQATPKSQVVSQPQSPSQTVPSQPQSPPSPRTKPQPVKTETLDVSSSPSRTTSQPKPATQKTSQPPSPSRTSQPQPQPATQKTSQPPSPSRTSQPQPQPATQRTSQPSSPTLTVTKTERTSQPPSSPIRPASQLATKTVSQPSSPSRIGQETKTHKASPPQSPSIQAPRSQPTTPPFKPTSPPKSFASRTEPPAEKLFRSQPEMYKPVPEYQPENETYSEPGSEPQKQAQLQRTYQPDLETKRPSYTTVGPDQHPLSEKKQEEIKRDETKIKPQEKPMIETDVEPKQMASGSNLVTRGLLGTKADEEKPPLKKHTPTDEKEIPAMASKENVRRTTVPISQEGRKERHEDFPKPSMPHGERAALHKDIRDDISKFVQKLSTEHPNQSNDEHPASVITLAGENRGATMHLDSDAERKEGAIRIHRGYKLNQDKEATTDGETSSKAERSNDPVTTEDSTSMVYINSNTQSVNNSLVFNSSIDEGSPGVHLVFSQNHREPPKSSGKPEPLPAHKADFNTTQSQKLTYDPTIRRRCLRGLMLEPSDSDPENPDKPRRHGCRYSCEDKKKAEDNGNEG